MKYLVVFTYYKSNSVSPSFGNWVCNKKSKSGITKHDLLDMLDLIRQDYEIPDDIRISILNIMPLSFDISDLEEKPEH